MFRNLRLKKITSNQTKMPIRRLHTKTVTPEPSYNKPTSSSLSHSQEKIRKSDRVLIQHLQQPKNSQHLPDPKAFERIHNSCTGFRGNKSLRRSVNKHVKPFITIDIASKHARILKVHGLKSNANFGIEDFEKFVKQSKRSITLNPDDCPIYCEAKPPCKKDIEKVIRLHSWETTNNKQAVSFDTVRSKSRQEKRSNTTRQEPRCKTRQDVYKGLSQKIPAARKARQIFPVRIKLRKVLSSMSPEPWSPDTVFSTSFINEI